MTDRAFSESVPLERQTLRLPTERLDSMESWATDGTALAGAAAVRDPSDRIVLVENDWSDGWVLPGGAVEPEETDDPAVAVQREVREETGLDAEVGQPLLEIDQTYVDAADGTERFTGTYLLYEATAAGDLPPAADVGVWDGEILAVRWFDSLPESLHDGDLLRQYLDG
jgi:8-oxo-dGTP diphosphatase